MRTSDNDFRLTKTMNTQKRGERLVIFQGRPVLLSFGAPSCVMIVIFGNHMKKNFPNIIIVIRMLVSLKNCAIFCESIKKKTILLLEQEIIQGIFSLFFSILI